MSMLTPPGMGGQYRIKGDKYPRMRQGRKRGRTVFSIIASVAVVGLVGWGTMQLIDVFTGSGEASAASAGDCAKPGPSASPEPRKVLPEPGAITVNVLNATPRGGLAKETADALKKRGFTIGEVGNATEQYDKKVKGTALLLGPDKARDTALPVLGTQIAGARVGTDARKGHDVDLIIGSGFKALAAEKTAAKALAALSAPAPAPKAPAHCERHGSS